MKETQLGFDKAPDRYSSSGRECIDIIRDAMQDHEFIAYCKGQVIKYRDRAGLKGPAEEDQKKADFYEQMMRCVMGVGGDPRVYRKGFQPYERKPYDGRHFQ